MKDYNQEFELWWDSKFQDRNPMLTPKELAKFAYLKGIEVMLSSNTVIEK